MSKQPQGERDIAASGPPEREGRQSAGANERAAEDNVIRGYN